MTTSKTISILIIVILIMWAGTITTLTQMPPDPTPTPISLPSPTETPVVLSQIQVLSTRVAELDEIVENSEKDIWDKVDSMNGVFTLMAAVIVGLLGSWVARRYEANRYKEEKEREDEHKRREQEREDEQKIRDQLHQDHELKVAQAQAVQVFIPFLEQKGTGRQAALSTLSELGNEMLSSRLSKIYTDEGEDPEFAEQQQAHLRDRLLRDVRNRSNEVTKLSIDWMRAEGWLVGEDGLLQRANLVRANLRGADLRGANLDDANLHEANLSQANLQEADLSQANLQEADLSLSNLQAANLRSANLEGANLYGAILEGANLSGVKLKGADLKFVNMGHANMFGVQCDKTTTLPNQKIWTPDVDWSQFRAVELDMDQWETYRRKQGPFGEDTD